MAEIRPFRALRYDQAGKVHPALTVAPPYDVISGEEQRALYERSEYNIVRIEYGEQLAEDSDSENRYTRAARDLDAWIAEGVLRIDDEPAIYGYRQKFEWGGKTHSRSAIFVALRLEPWDAGVVKPHEHTLSNPKADRLRLLRATATQVSPVYSIFRLKGGGAFSLPDGEPLADVTVDGQRHVLSAIRDRAAVRSITEMIASADVYIADGHHRYETALAYRDEMRARAGSWSGDEPENFVLMALTDAADPGLVVLPTHRLLTLPSLPVDALDRLSKRFRVESAPLEGAVDAAWQPRAEVGEFVALGLAPGMMHRLTLVDRAGVEALMPRDQPTSWKRLDVNVLQYGVLLDVFGIDDAALAAGGAVSYTQSTPEAIVALTTGDAKAAFLLAATPVEQVMAVADAGGRMPQKSTFFHPKLPTGLVMRRLS